MAEPIKNRRAEVPAPYVLPTLSLPSTEFSSTFDSTNV